MKNKSVIVVGVLLVVALLGFGAYYLSSSATISRNNATIADLQSQLSSASERIVTLENQTLSLGRELSVANNEAAVAKVEVSLLTSQVSSANSQLASLKQENARLTEIITPTKPTHNVLPIEHKLSSTYWNVAWSGREYQLQQTARQVNTTYFQTHTYIVNETDCNDMACDIWDMLKRQGVISLIVIGNLNVKDDTFTQCNHTWLLIPNSAGTVFALEPTNGQLYFAGDPQASQYLEGYLYAKPSDLRADIGSRW